MAEAEMEIIAPIDKLNYATFTPEEMTRWKTVRRAVDSMLTVDGIKPLINSDYWNALLLCALNYKSLMKDLPFDGITPQQGFGARPIIIEDVSSAQTPDTAVEWDVDALALTANDRRIWLGDNSGALYAAQYLAATTRIIPRDVQDDKWGVAVVGAMERRNTGVVKSLNFDMNGEHKIEVPIESQMEVAQSNLHAIPYAELGLVIWNAPGFSFSAGARTRANLVGGTALRPVGLTFGTSVRLRRTVAGANVPNRATRAS